MSLARLLQPRLLTLLAQIVLVAFLIGWLSLVLLLAGVDVRLKETPQIDFISFWTASSLAIDGPAADTYDTAQMHERERRDFGESVKAFPWLYPPSSLVLVSWLGLLPVAIAFVLWVALSGLVAFLAVRSISRQAVVLWLAVSFPATLWNLFLGQTGLLTAGLFALGMMLLRSSPIAAGIAFGLLSFKPHFAALVVVALVVSGNWRALSAALASSALLVIASLFLFGLAPWQEFFDELPNIAGYAYQGTFRLESMQSVTAFLLALGASGDFTKAVQLVAAFTAMALVVWLWRGQHSFEDKAAGLALATLLATPHSFHYDLTFLGLAVLWQVVAAAKSSWLKWEPELFALAWLTPILTVLTASALGVGITPLILPLLIWSLLRHTRMARPYAAVTVQLEPAATL